MVGCPTIDKNINPLGFVVNRNLISIDAGVALFFGGKRNPMVAIPKSILEDGCLWLLGYGMVNEADEL